MGSGRLELSSGHILLKVITSELFIFTGTTVSFGCLLYQREIDVVDLNSFALEGHHSDGGLLDFLQLTKASTLIWLRSMVLSAMHWVTTLWLLIIVFMYCLNPRVVVNESGDHPLLELRSEGHFPVLLPTCFSYIHSLLAIGHERLALSCEAERTISQRISGVPREPPWAASLS